MAARWMQQKQMKIKRMRRAYLKRYPSGGVDINKINAYEVFQNRGRVRTNKGEGEGYEPIQDNTFTKEIPVHSPKWRAPKAGDTDNPLVRDANALFEVTQTDRLQHVTALIKGPVVHQDGPIKVYLYFSGSKYALCKEGKTFRRTSSVYSNRDELLNLFFSDRLVWITFDKLTPSEDGEVQQSDEWVFVSI